MNVPMRRNSLKRAAAIAVSVLGALLTPGALQAGSLTLSTTSGTNQASATFSMLNNSTLQVILSNTSITGAASSSDVLTGFFFATSTGVAAPTSVTAAAGSIQNCPLCPSNATDVSGQWLWGSNVTGLGGTAPAYALASTSFGFLTSPIAFNPLELSRGASNVDFGLVSPNTSFGQSAFTGSPLVTQQLVFTFAVGAGFDTTTIVSGGFLWGSTLVPLGAGQLSLYGASSPEPGSLLLIGGGLAAMALFARRRARRRQTAPAV